MPIGQPPMPPRKKGADSHYLTSNYTNSVHMDCKGRFKPANAIVPHRSQEASHTASSVESSAVLKKMESDIICAV